MSFCTETAKCDIMSQNPFFSKRVELKDSHLKSGDLSVILKNITSMDSGMYTCEAKISSHEKKKISHEMNVTVTEAGESLWNYFIISFVLLSYGFENNKSHYNLIV
ncbi:hypothetical protein NL108_018611 [Boleophthalmus pectinirostris]|nr:hypothetical protein NL108_018611 [Boleophthalmus pectinirostris]